MSVFDVGTAFVRVLPDTTKFRAVLETELAAITKSVQATVAVRPVLERTAAATGTVSTGAAAAATSTGELGTAATQAAAAVTELVAAETAATSSASQLATATSAATLEILREAQAAGAAVTALQAQAAAETTLAAAIAERSVVPTGAVSASTATADLAAATGVAAAAVTELAGADSVATEAATALAAAQAAVAASTADVTASAGSAATASLAEAEAAMTAAAALQTQAVAETALAAAIREKQAASAIQGTTAGAASTVDLAAASDTATVTISSLAASEAAASEAASALATAQAAAAASATELAAASEIASTAVRAQVQASVAATAALESQTAAETALAAASAERAVVPAGTVAVTAATGDLAVATGTAVAAVTDLAAAETSAASSAATFSAAQSAAAASTLEVAAASATVTAALETRTAAEQTLTSAIAQRAVLPASEATAVAATGDLATSATAAATAVNGLAAAQTAAGEAATADAAAQSALAAATAELTTVSGAAGSAIVKQEAAALAVSRAQAAEVRALKAVTTAIEQKATAERIEELQTRASIAAQAVRVAQLRQQTVLSETSGAAASATRQQAEASLTLTRAQEAQVAAQRAVTVAIAEGASARRIEDLQIKESIADRQLEIAQLRERAILSGATAGPAGATVAATELAAAETAAAEAGTRNAAVQAALAESAIAASGANEALAASTALAAAGQEALTAAETSSAEVTAARAAAVRTLTVALQTQATVEAELTAAIEANAAASQISALTNRLGAASSASNVARLRLEELGKSMTSTGVKADLLQGSIVGISRVTAISALGLTAWSAAAVAAGLAIRSAIVSTADFEHQLNVFQGTTNATAADMRAVSDEAKQLGADLSLPATSAGDAARAMTELAKAGLSIQDSLRGARGVLQLAAAAQLDVGQAAEFVATELNAFGLAGDQATHVADLLAGASIAAQGSIQDFGSAFQQVSAVSHQVNLSLEDTTGALTELAQAGLRGADGGTSLRTALLRLVPTTKEAAQFQKALGIQLDNTRSVGEQLPELLDQYKVALEALTPVQQQQALAQIFGQDAIRAASILIQGGSAALKENTDQANQNGAASRLAEANAKGLSGAFAGLKSNLDTLSITAGNFAKGPLTDLVTGFSLGVGGVNKFVDALSGLQQKIADISPDVPVLSDALSILFKPSPEKILGPVGTAADVASRAFSAFRKGADEAGNKAVQEAQKQNEAFVAGLEAADQSLAKGVHDEAARFGNELVDAAKIHDESRTQGLQHLTEQQKEATRKRVAALNQAAAAGANLEVKIPLSLQAQQVDAQIAGNLAAEAAIDAKIITFLEGKRARLEKGSAAYIAVGRQIDDAKRAQQSALDQATSAAAEPPKIPIGLENAQLDAEIAGNVQTELATDNKIVAFLTGALDRAKGNAVKYKAAAEALKAATAARDAVLNQIASDRKQEQQRQQEAFQQALQNQQTRLEIAAETAGATSDAQQRLIAFLTKEAKDERLTTEQRLSFEKQRQSEVKKQQAAIVETAKAQIDLRNAILDTQLSAAELTPGIEDNKRVLERQIQAANEDIERQKKIAAANKKGSQARIDALIAIQKDLQTINGLKASIKGLTEQGQSFSLQDLFKEAIDQFNTFGSNISSVGQGGLLSPQDFRAELSSNVLEQLGKDSLTEADKQTTLLEQIAQNTSKDPRQTKGTPKADTKSILPPPPGLAFTRLIEIAADAGFGGN